MPFKVIIEDILKATFLTPEPISRREVVGLIGISCSHKVATLALNTLVRFYLSYIKLVFDMEGFFPLLLRTVLIIKINLYSHCQPLQQKTILTCK